MIFLLLPENTLFKNPLMYSIQLHRQTSDPSSYKKSSAPKLYFDVSLKSMRECM